MSSENGDDLKFNNIQTNNFDSCGKVIIKAQLRDDIRRVPIHNEEITYDELVLMMQRVFRGQLNPDDDIVIKYKDEDGDMVTIFDSADLAFALQYSRILKLKIYMKGKDGVIDAYKTQESRGLDSLDNVGDLRRELRFIRDRVNKVLDVLADNSSEGEALKLEQNSNSAPSEVSSKTDLKSEAQDVQVVPRSTAESTLDKVVYPSYDSNMVPDGPMVSAKPSVDGFGHVSEASVAHFNTPASTSSSQLDLGMNSVSMFPVVNQQATDDKISSSFMAQTSNGSADLGGYSNMQHVNQQMFGPKSGAVIGGGAMPPAPSSASTGSAYGPPPSTYTAGVTAPTSFAPTSFAPATAYNAAPYMQQQAQSQMSYQQFNAPPSTSAYSPRPVGPPQGVQGYMVQTSQGYMPSGSGAPGAPTSPSMQRMGSAPGPGGYMSGPALQGPPPPGPPCAMGGNNPYARNPPPAAWK